MKYLLLVIAILTGTQQALADDDDYKTSEEFLALRDSMHHAFNDADSARFFPAVARLQEYLLKQNDLHAYYTQRCNEIVFQMNRQRIYEAYILGRQLSAELRERKLDKEMYMAYNMLGHINRYCGNKEAARRNFYQALEMMQEHEYYENMPPIYMNLLNVELSDDSAEAFRLIDQAADIAHKYSPERVFDIETRRSLVYYNSGNIPRFLEGYKAYREGVEQGKNSVHGRWMEVYYLASTGQVDKAVELAHKELGDEGLEAITKIYEQAGRWKDAYESLRSEANANDSIANVVLINSMEGIRDQLTIYDVESENARIRTYTLVVIIGLLLLLIAALGYIMFSHRRHMKQLKRAYEHALESDKMKTAFIQNMTHEVRTPLNIISGFAQVIANPDLSGDVEQRKEIAKMMLKNTHIITNEIDEMLELSLNESSGAVVKEDVVDVNNMVRGMLNELEKYAPKTVSLSLDSTLPKDFTIVSHRNMLHRAIDVLLDNSLKNTQQGRITVRSAIVDDALQLAVEDTGCGIPAENAERVFERFFKIDSFKSGLGLGLSLCRMIITRLGGTIVLDTTYTTGARFIISLPL